MQLSDGSVGKYKKTSRTMIVIQCEIWRTILPMTIDIVIVTPSPIFHGLRSWNIVDSPELDLVVLRGGIDVYIVNIRVRQVI